MGGQSETAAPGFGLAIGCACFASSLMALLLIGSPVVFQESSLQKGINDLIDELANISEPSVGFANIGGTTWYFPPTDDPTSFDPELYGAPIPEVPAALRELVAHGAAALPLLIEHLDDARVTRLRFVTHGYEQVSTDQHLGNGDWPAADILLEDSYDPRHLERERQPRNVTVDFVSFEPNPMQEVDHYDVKVGDVCFVAIGQIVNRELEAVGFGGSNTIEVNSPIERPELIAAIKQDWSGLSRDGHCRALAKDAWAISHLDEGYRSRQAVRRLLYYFPEAGERTLVGLLNREPYDWSFVARFAEDRLVPSSLETATAKLAAFRSEFNLAAAIGAVKVLNGMHLRFADDLRSVAAGHHVSVGGVPVNATDMRKKDRHLQDLLRVLVTLVGGEDALQTIVTLDEQAFLIEDTAYFASRSVDNSIVDFVDRAQSCQSLDDFYMSCLIEATQYRIEKLEPRQSSKYLERELSRLLDKHD